jgi:membrane-bound inhibitor of C-type lysozyme
VTEKESKICSAQAKKTVEVAETQDQAEFVHINAKLVLDRRNAGSGAGDGGTHAYPTTAVELLL